MSSVWLMYHDVYAGEPVAGLPRSAAMYHLSAARFESHLQTIERSGLRVVTAGEFLSGSPETNDTLVLTFDDGWKGAFETAVPLLLERRWKATFFVTRDFVGRSNFCDAGQLREAAAAGMEIGIHGTTHRMLSSCTHREIVEEFRVCKDYLESLLGQPVAHASLPGGDLTPTVVSCAQEAEVRSLSNSRPGVNQPTTPRFDLRRIAMKTASSAAEVERLCRFAVRRELARWALFQIARGTLGMKRYSRVRRMVLRKRDPDEIEVFKP